MLKELADLENPMRSNTLVAESGAGADAEGDALLAPPAPVVTLPPAPARWPEPAPADERPFVPSEPSAGDLASARTSQAG